MAGAIGPSSNLPGSVIAVPAGMMCDNHEGRPATRRVVGETDSFGSEVEDLCDECYADRQQWRKDHSEDLGECEHCGAEKKHVKPARDPAEGSCGPVYMLCPECAKRMFQDFIGD